MRTKLRVTPQQTVLLRLLLFVLAALPSAAAAQSAGDSTTVARLLAIAVARDVIVSSASPSTCVMLSTKDAPDAFLAILRDSIRSRFGDRLATDSATVPYQLRALHLALTSDRATLDVITSLGRPRDTTTTQWRAVYFADRDRDAWQVRPALPRELAHEVPLSRNDPDVPCLGPSR